MVENSDETQNNQICQLVQNFILNLRAESGNIIYGGTEFNKVD